MMIPFDKMKRGEQQAYLMMPCLRELKRLGGQSSTKDLKRAVVENDSQLPASVLTDYKMGKSGLYLPFDFPFNFAVSNLVMAGMLERPKQGTVKLTEKGRVFSGTVKELSESVYKISLPQWQKRIEHNKEVREAREKNEGQSVTETYEESSDSQAEIDRIQNTGNDSEEEAGWRGELLHALLNLSPGKFEMFCRALARKMNVQIDEKIGTQLTNDGGLDGYGYITTDDFRTSRVAIQAKKWDPSHEVTSPEIDKFRGAMDKFRAEYGIFITTSSFSRGAVKTSRNGTHVITLIDGDKLMDLIAKYQLYVEPVTTYKLDSFFTKNK